jgi:hypothetical protein
MSLSQGLQSFNTWWFDVALWRSGTVALCLDIFQSLPLAPACDCEQIPAMTQGFRCDMQKNRID